MKTGMKSSFKTKKNVNKYVKIILENAKYFSNDTLLNMKFTTFLKLFLSSQDVTTFIKLYGYKYQLHHFNAYHAIIDIENTINTNYFAVHGGLSTIINSLYKKYIELGGKLVLHTTFLHYDKLNHFSIQTDKRVYRSYSLTLTLSPEELKRNHITFPFFKYIKGVSLSRIYYFYRNEQPSIDKMITNTDLGFIIPINNKVFMISYTDGDLADIWGSLSDIEIKLKVKKELKKINIKISEPDEMVIEYWKDAVHVWRKGITLSNFFNPNDNLYLCNEAYSNKQGWIEGSLEMAEQIKAQVV